MQATVFHTHVYIGTVLALLSTVRITSHRMHYARLPRLVPSWSVLGTATYVIAVICASGDGCNLITPVLWFILTRSESEPQSVLVWTILLFSELYVAQMRGKVWWGVWNVWWMWSVLFQIKRKGKTCKVIITQILSADGRHRICVLHTNWKQILLWEMCSSFIKGAFREYFGLKIFRCIHRTGLQQNV